MISKFQVGLISLLRHEFSEHEFYEDLVYRLKKIAGSNNFSVQFIIIISHYKKIGYNIDVLQQTACLVFNPITFGNFAFLFTCTPVGRTSDSMTFLTYKTYVLMRWLRPDALTVTRPTGVYLLDFFCSSIQFYELLSPYLRFISYLYLVDDALIS